MVTRVNGAPRQGVWFSADVRFLTITATGATFLADLVDPADLTVAGTPAVSVQRAAAVNSGLEQVLEAVATRGTIIGMSVVATDTTTVNLIVDYAQAFDAAALGNGPVINVVTETVAAINAIDTTGDGNPNLSGATVAVFEGFAGAALGVAV